MLMPARNEIVFLSGTVLMISVAASNAASSNDTGGLWPSSFDFSFASKPEPNTCKSTDMCGTMPGICKHGDCRTRPCTNAIICDCHAGWEGVYCETKISTADQPPGKGGPTNGPGKTLVNGNVDKTLLNGKEGPGSSVSSKSVVNGIAITTDKTNGNGNGINNGATPTSGKKPVDNGIKDNGTNNTGNSVHMPKTSTTIEATVETTTKSDASTTPKQNATTIPVKSSTQELTTKESVKTTTVAHSGRPGSVGEQINQKLQNGEIKVENVLDVLIASVKENEALAKNKSASTKQDPHVTTTQSSISKETTVPKPVTTADTRSSAETTATPRTTIHPDGSFIKGPESTFLSDNSPLNLESANKTIKQSMNKIPVRNTTDTVTIPSTVLTLSGISVPSMKNCTNNCSKGQEADVKSGRDKTKVKDKLDMQNTAQTSSANPTFRDDNGMKLEKIVESIIIHKPKESVISKSKGTVNIQRSSIDKSAKQTRQRVSPNQKGKDKNDIKSDSGAKTLSVDKIKTTSVSQTTKQNTEITTQTTPMPTITDNETTSTKANT